MMLDYIMDEDLCRHCARQIRTGKPENAFSREQYDNWPAETAIPPYPSMLTFRMSNTCNLACIMCTGNLSSRIRRERENRPNPPSVYREPFFEEIREILPHVRHIEFFGGEPFLVKEHLRIFDLIRETGSESSIYVNTNGMSLSNRVKRFLEDLNFTCIAVSMDGLNPKLLSSIRIGIKPDRFFQNLKWYLDLRNRKPVHVLLNVTELRQNWFELPEMFRFAANIDCSLHINTCIHPTYCTLYDLPTDQLNYVFEFLKRSKDTLSDVLKVRGNERSYDHLLGMIRTELEKRTPNTDQPECARLDPSVYGTDGLLAAPRIGFGIFRSPEQVLAEVNRLKPFVSGFGDRLLSDIQAQARAVSGTVEWQRVEQIIASLRRDHIHLG
jgi:sulfatase maturation enzyme AslB (radical SAM superfamily)